MMTPRGGFDRVQQEVSERAGLRAENAALSSQLSQAAATGRIQRLAMKRLGFTPATPEQTSFVHLGH